MHAAPAPCPWDTPSRERRHSPRKVVTIPSTDAGFEAVYRTHERFVWGLCYRLTGSAADADDLVQETFVRAIATPPSHRDWRPWLVRVAVNLGRDLLRRRKRQSYVGPWLPSPVESSALEAEALTVASPGHRDGEARYDLAESARYAFLIAVEALTAQQRAVLLLRDVLDYSVRETAGVLDVSEGSVKVTHLRARRAMQDYDAARSAAASTGPERVSAAIIQFLSALAAGDTAAIEALLATDVRTVNDGGGVFIAALRPVLGRNRVARFYLGLARQQGPDVQVEMRSINGLPAIVMQSSSPKARAARRFVLRFEVNADGLIREIDAVLAPRKLSAVRFEGAES